MKLYLAGPMTGIQNDNRNSFNKAEFHLTGFIEHVVLNPTRLPAGLEQHEYMDICCAMVRASDGIVLLDGWENSEGATAEYYLAKKLGKKVFGFGADYQLEVLEA